MSEENFENNPLELNDEAGEEQRPAARKPSKKTATQVAVEVEKSVKEKAEEKPEPTGRPVAVPKLFFKKNDTIEVRVYGYHSKEDGELSFAVPVDQAENLDDSLAEVFTRVEYKFWFSPCPYDKLNRYRTRSMIYNSEDQNNTINNMRLREFFLTFHLIRWNLTDENGRPVELKFDPNRALSQETLDMIYMLPPKLMDTVLFAYERKLGV